MAGTTSAPIVTPWSARRDLLASDGGDRHYVVEVDDGRAHLRFGEGVLGWRPQTRTRFTATYRVGNGPSGNVGAESIRHLVLRRLSLSGVALRPRNPLPAQGGTRPEPLAEVKLFAPDAFRKDLQRAITGADYATLVERDRDFKDDIQRVAGDLRWTGSWYEARVAIDQRATFDLDEPLRAKIQQGLARYRRIGHDLRVEDAREVPLAIALCVTVQDGYLRGHVKAALLAELGAGRLPDGRLGYFHPDNLTFGEAIYASKLVALATAVPGVESVMVTRLERQFEGAVVTATGGTDGERPAPPILVPLGPLEIARLDNDPSRPENGVLMLDMRGGRWSPASCGCCDGPDVLTPLPIANRPGLDALTYRVGTHASFLETMLARLSSQDFPALNRLGTRDPTDPSIALLDGWATVADILTFYQERIANEGFLRTATERRSVLELARLIGYRLRPGVAASVYLAYTLEKDAVVTIPAGSRSQSVPGAGELPQSFETSEPLEARAAWNDLKPRMRRPQDITVNTRELYLKGLATGLKPNDPLVIAFGTGRPTVLYRVLTVDLETKEDRTRITYDLWNPVRTSADDPSPAPAPLPGPLTDGELDEMRDLARGMGGFPASVMQSRLRRFALKLVVAIAALGELGTSDAEVRARKRFVDVLGESRPDLVAVRDRENVNAEVRRLAAAAIEMVDNALATLGPDTRPTAPATPADPGQPARPVDRAEVIASLLATTLSASRPIRTGPNLATAFDSTSDLRLKMRIALQPALNPLYTALRNALVAAPAQVTVFAPRLRASLFGHNTPMRTSVSEGQPVKFTEWEIYQKIESDDDVQPGPATEAEKTNLESPTQLFLDNAYDAVRPGSLVVLLKPDAAPPLILQPRTAAVRSRAAYGMSAKTTELTFSTSWRQDDALFSVIRGTVVLAQPEQLELADEPDDDPVDGAEIELDALVEGLEAGRWLIVSGERTDLVGTSGVRASELVSLAGVRQDVSEVPGADGDVPRPGDKLHTFLVLGSELVHTYKRDTVKIYGNVVKATHGETRVEVLGSGDGSKALQQFPVKQPPLTYVAAPTAAGAASTLVVRVDEVKWDESDSLARLGRTDRAYLIRTDDAGQTSVIFGNGEHGARLPTGVENVRATYRNGIGKLGNVEAEQISLLVSKPLGVKEVVNPLRASGGAGPEDRDQARRNAPLAVLALDHLVSVQDYADFARTFAGIGKASAARLTDGRQQVVHLTIAGADDVPIDVQSDLYRALRLALRRLGGAAMPVRIDVRALMLLTIRAGVRVLPDYDWTLVEPRIRAALLDAFGFARRELGQDVFASEVVRVIHAVRGVEYVDLRALDAMDEDGRFVSQATPPPALLNRIVVEVARADPLRAAQLAVLSPEVPDTIILEEISR